MMPIDLFINQLIHLGLADSFLEVVEKHYLKVSTIYNTISLIDEENVKEINMVYGDDIDTITVIIELYTPVDLSISNNNEELTVQLNNEGTTVEITVTNIYESEDEIYESRFNGRRTPYTHKWS
jgi:hypothetical protein